MTRDKIYKILSFKYVIFRVIKKYEGRNINEELKNSIIFDLKQLFNNTPYAYKVNLKENILKIDFD